MFEGLFGEEEGDGGTWDSAPVAVFRGSKMPTPSRPTEEPFIGLSNQGATCYLNSLVHALYFTPYFRQGLYELKEEDLVVDENKRGQTNFHSGSIPGYHDSTSAGNFDSNNIKSGDLDPNSSTSSPEHGESSKEFVSGSAAFDVTSSNKNGFNEASSLNDEEEEQMAMLMSMGFETDRILKALKRWSPDQDRTGELKMDWLLQGGGLEEEPTESSGDLYTEEDFFAAFNDESAISAPELESDTQIQTPHTTEGTTQAGNDYSSTASVPHSGESSSIQNDSKQAGMPESAPKKKVREVPQALQRLFGMLELGDVSFATTEDLTASFNWKSSHTTIQHDVHELNRVLMDVVERSLRNTKKQDLVRSVFHGLQSHQIKCKSCGTVKERSEEFGDLTLAIPRTTSPNSTKGASKASKSTGSGTSLEMCMEHYFGMEILEGSNQYECDVCACKTDAEIGMRIKKLPQILCLSLARMEYNFQTGTRVKNTGKVSFPPSIDLFPFLSDDQMRERLSDEGAAAELGLAGTNQSSSLTLTEQSPLPSTIYDLYAIIIHKGASATSGHYHAYIKDLLNISNSPALFSVPDDDIESDTPSVPKKSKKPKTKAKPSGEEGEAWKRQEYFSDLQRLPNLAQNPTNTTSPIQNPASIWFDFDDTRVRRVDASSIPKLFSSSECAYMFFYKQRDVSCPIGTAHQVAAPSALNAIASDVRSIASLFNLSPPQHLVDHIKSVNENLLQAREVYLKEQNQLEISLNWTTNLVSYLLPSHISKGTRMAKSIEFNKFDETQPKQVLENLMKIGTGPPAFSWNPALLKTKTSSGTPDTTELMPGEVTLKVDSRHPLKSFIPLLIPHIQPLIATEQVNAPQFFNLDLLRTYHDKVMIEKSFSLPLSVLRDSSPEDLEQLTEEWNKSFKDLDFAKNQTILVRPSSTFLEASILPVPNMTLNGDKLMLKEAVTGDLEHEKQLGHFSSLAGNSARATGILNPLTPSVQWTKLAIRLFHEKFDSSQFKIGDSELLGPRLFYDDESAIRTTNSQDSNPYHGGNALGWNDICFSLISISSLNEPATGSSDSSDPCYFSVLEAWMPPTLTVNRLAEFISTSSTLFKKLSNPASIARLPSDSSTMSLMASLDQPHLFLNPISFEPEQSSASSLKPTSNPIIVFGEDDDTPKQDGSEKSQIFLSPHSSVSLETLGYLDTEVTKRREYWKGVWNEDEGWNEAALATLNESHILVSEPSSISSNIIMTFFSSHLKSMAAAEWQQKATSFLSTSLLGSQADDCTQVDDPQSSQQTTSTTSQSATGKKRKYSFNVYAFIALKLPKSAFTIGGGSIPMNKPLESDDKETDGGKSKSSSVSTSFQPRFIIRGLSDSTTVRELIQKIWDESGLPGESVGKERPNSGVSGTSRLPSTGLLPLHARLYSMDAFDQKEKLYDNLSLTLKQIGLSAYHSVWLEEGSEPLPGLLSLHVSVFRYNLRKEELAKTETLTSQSPLPLSSAALVDSTPYTNTREELHPLITPTSAQRPNILLIPLSLNINLPTFSTNLIPGPTSETKDTTASTSEEATKAAQPEGTSSVPVPPPLPPKSTIFEIETTIDATVASLKDEIAGRIEDEVRTNWSRICLAQTPPCPVSNPPLDFFHKQLPFDFFLAKSSEERRQSMCLWFEESPLLPPYLLDSTQEVDYLPLKAWRLNSWQRSKIAVSLLQTFKSISSTSSSVAPIPCYSISERVIQPNGATEETEEGRQAAPLATAFAFDVSETASDGNNSSSSNTIAKISDSIIPIEIGQGKPKLLSLAIPPRFASNAPIATSLLIFFRERTLKAPPSLVDPNETEPFTFGPSSSAWLSILKSATVTRKTPAKNKNTKHSQNLKHGKKETKKTLPPNEEGLESISSTERKNNLPHNASSSALVDLEAIVKLFSEHASASSGPTRSIPSEWLLLAKIGMYPHNHDMQMPKWQLLWKPSAYLAACSSAPDSGPSDVTTQEGVNVSKVEVVESELERPTESSSDNRLPSVSASSLPPSIAGFIGGDLNDEGPAPPRHEILMKHLMDPKIPGASEALHSTVLGDSTGKSATKKSKNAGDGRDGLKKVKISHGDVLVFADARNWHPQSHEDIFWDNQRKIGSGKSAEDQYLSDMERAILESTKSSYARNNVEHALTIDIDF